MKNNIDTAAIEQFAESSGADKHLGDILDERYDEYGNFEYYPPESPIIDPTDNEMDMFAEQFSTAVLREEYAQQREQIRDGLYEIIDGMRSADAPVQISSDYPVNISEEDIDSILTAMLEDSLDEREGEDFAGDVAESVTNTGEGERESGSMA